MVLKAFDPTLGRAVAIKVLAPQLATSAAARSRFAREARAAAAVVHDHVVAIHSVDSWNGLPYLVMPFIPGQSLQERVDRDGPMDLKQVLRIGIQTAQGLESAHAQGLVHRDVKPSNILLENGVERVKLTDFGLARAVDDASLTQSGVVAGTPQYMSPEQARGEPVDHRSDLFSLGSVIYFMCAGHAPFRASSTPAVLRRVRTSSRGRSARSIPTCPSGSQRSSSAFTPRTRVIVSDRRAKLRNCSSEALAAVQRGLPVLVAPRKAGGNRRPILRGKSRCVSALSIAGFALALAAYRTKVRIVRRISSSGSPAEIAERTGDRDRRSIPRQVVIVIVESSDSEPIVGSGKPLVKRGTSRDSAGCRSARCSTRRSQRERPSRSRTTADDNVSRS